VDEQARQLAELIETMMYSFGTQSMDGECCENITHGEFRALHAALHQEVCTMQDIAQKGLVTKSGATRIVARLEDKGLAYREQDRNDGRVCCVQLTEAGKSILSRIEDRLAQRIKSILTEMGPAMREVLIISLGAFVRSAQRQMAGKNRLAPTGKSVQKKRQKAKDG